MATLEGRVALVTGAGGERGFGRAIARRLAAEGVDLVVTDIAPTGLQAVVELDEEVKGTFLTARAVARSMLERRVRGRIVNMASQWVLALELAPAGITVNAVCPGAADTDRLDSLGRRDDGSYDEALRAERIKQQAAAIPLGRLATADDVVAVVAFLVSDGAEYVTGQSINVTGGSVMH